MLGLSPEVPQMTNGATGWRGSGLAWCIFLNGLTAAIIAYFVVFFFFPHKIVFVGTGFAAATAIFWFVVNSFKTYGQRLLAVRKLYIDTILSYPSRAVSVSVVLLLAAGIWTAYMFDAIKDRFYYLQALDRAIPFLEADQLGVPTPKDIAVAFNHNPQ